MFVSQGFGKTVSRVLPVRYDPLPFLQKVVFLVVLFSGFAGCSTVEVEEAFKGNLPPIKSNKTINTYCKSCHIHKDFVPAEHVLKVKKIYKNGFYRNAKECRICHFIKKVWARDAMMRKTRYPRSVDRGMFREFEQEEIKKMKKNRKSKKSFLGL